MQNIQKYGGLKLLNAKKLSESLLEFVDKDENHALNNFVDGQLKDASNSFKKALCDENINNLPSEVFKQCVGALTLNPDAAFPIENFDSNAMSSITDAQDSAQAESSLSSNFKKDSVDSNLGSNWRL